MFITNQPSESITLGARLGELMNYSRQLDMLVGFFYFSGVSVLVEPLKNNPNLRLRVLVGMEADTFCNQLVECVRTQNGASADEIRASFYNSIGHIVRSEQVDKESFYERLEIFIKLLKENRLEIRKTREPNHAKLYIFTMDEAHEHLIPRSWITGSSNFSEPGLELRNELNVEIHNFGSEKAIDYYEKLWENAVPLTDDPLQRQILINILMNESVAAALTPYEAYYLILKNYMECQSFQLNTARIERILKDAQFKQYRYQTDAVTQALLKLDAYNGVIIADVVGLGKSIIAGLIGAMRQKRGLIICPPGLIGEPDGASGGWNEYKRRFRLYDWEIWSLGKLDVLLKKLQHDNDFDMVIIDEAHNFRNEDTDKYELLAQVCYNKEVVLLTATPFNNRPSDLLALLHLFSNGRNSLFVPGGNLDVKFKLFSTQYENARYLNRAIIKRDHEAIKRYLKKCEIALEPEFNGEYDLKKVRKAAAVYSKAIAKNIRQIMEKIVIRRNRIDLVNDPDYSTELTALPTVQPPVQQFFELTPEQNQFYDSVITDYFGPEGSFHGTVYRPQNYLKNQDGLDEYQNNVYWFMQRLLVQRFESSFGAFRQTLVNIHDSMIKTQMFIKRMGRYLYSRKAMDKILSIENDYDALEALEEAIIELMEEYERSGKSVQDNIVYEMNNPGFNGKKFQKHLKEDIELFERLIAKVDELKLSTEDPKCAKLVSVIEEVLNGTHAGILPENAPKRKVLLFTAYSDTLDHIKPFLDKKFPKRVLAIDSRNFTQQNARTVQTNFDASFEVQEDDFDILITTDKLSEGFNLNRAGVVVNYDIPWNPTRVIQRVGRINRIGSKVFDNLYIFHFFPTEKGAAITQNQAIAQEKMFTIHEILGEDAKIFSIDEEPSPAALYKKITQGLDDAEELSFYSELKQKFNSAHAFLATRHPEELKRIEQLPAMVKTARLSDKPGAFLFRRLGPSFFAFFYNLDTNEIEEWTLEDAIQAVECDYNERQEPFSPLFWDRKGDNNNIIPGMYSKLKQFADNGNLQQERTRNNLSYAVQACIALQKAMPEMSTAQRKFSQMLIQDINSVGSIPFRTIKRMAQCGQQNSQDSPLTEEQIKDLKRLVDILYKQRGENYLDRIQTHAQDEIIVTIEQKQMEN